MTVPKTLAYLRPFKPRVDQDSVLMSNFYKACVIVRILVIKVPRRRMHSAYAVTTPHARQDLNTDALPISGIKEDFCAHALGHGTDFQLIQKDLRQIRKTRVPFTGE